MDLKALKDLLRVLRSNGVLSYSSSELSLTLSEELPSKVKKTSDVMDDKVDLEEAWEKLSDEDKLLWSTGQ